MNKIYSLLLLIVLVAVGQPKSAFAQSGAPVKAPADTLKGIITADKTLTNDKIWFLSGYVYVDSLVTLTVQPGTIVKGIRASNGTLFVQRGGKLVAQGTSTNPIIFTSDQSAGSRARQDWGGILLLGRATVNTPANAANNTAAGENRIEGLQAALITDGKLSRNFYGGKSSPVDNDNSGIVSYVRIEYAGIPNPAVSNSETNGLTLGGVGNGTQIDHVMVTEGGDDAYEWFGGTVNCKYLIANGTQDDDFDSDFGYSGNVQFGLGRKVNTIFDIDASNGFESDNNNNSGTNYGSNPVTKANFANMTCIGYSFKTRQEISDSTNGSTHQFALRIRRNSRIGVFNSVFSGFGSGLRLENDSTIIAIKTRGLDAFQFENNVITQITPPSSSSNGRHISTAILSQGVVTWSATDSANWVSTRSLANETFLEDLGFTAPYLRTYFQGPNFKITGTPKFDVRGKAAWTNARIATNSFFDKVSYIGAVDPNSTTPWHDAPWACWNPQFVPYDSLGRITANELVQADMKATVYPNPAANSLKIDFTMPTSGVASVDLVDLNGRLVSSFTTSKLAVGNNSIELNVSNIETGMYIALITANGSTDQVRVLISR